MEYRINENGIIENCQLSENLFLYDLLSAEMKESDIRYISECLSVHIVHNLEMLAQNVLEHIIQAAGYVPVITKGFYISYDHDVNRRQIELSHICGYAADLMVHDDISFIVQSLNKVDFDLALYDFNSLHIQYRGSRNRHTTFRVKDMAQYEGYNHSLSYLG